MQKKVSSGQGRGWTALGLLLAAAGVGAVSLLLATGPYGRTMFYSYFAHPGIVIFNLAPVMLAAVLGWFLTGRAWAGYALVGAAVTALSVANYFKILFRSDPVVAADLGLAGEAANMAGRYIDSLSWKVIFAVAAFLAGLVFLALCCRARPAETGRGRLIGFALLLALTLGLGRLFCGGGYITNVVWYRWTVNEDLINRWSATQLYISKGFVYPFLHSIPGAAEQKPNGYKKSEAEAILAAHPDADIPDDQKVNIISIMLEGFNDLTVFADLDLAADPYAAYHALEAESYTGRLVTNIFAAGTVNTERCHITGMTDFGNLRTNCWSYARYFASQGYHTEGSHPSHDWFYNRKNVNEYLGFDDYYFLENHYADLTGGETAMDDVFLPELYALLDENEGRDKPLFSFNVTYQNHGPYPTDRLKYDTEYVKKGVYSDESYYILNNYLGGVAQTAHELSALAARLADDERPVILIFYGDHNPWLGDENSVYNELGVDFDLDTVDGFLNYYATRYGIWANDAAKAVLGTDFTGEGPAIGPYFLMPLLFDLCGWEGPALTQLARPLMTRVPVANNAGVFLCDGRLCSGLPDDLTDAWRDYSFASYFLRKNP